MDLRSAFGKGCQQQHPVASPFKFYQFWINSDDEGVEEYLKIYTELDKTTIDDAMDIQKEQPSSRYAQKLLALEVTKLVHGQQKAESSTAVSEVLFSGIGYEKLSATDFALLKEDLPVISAVAGQTELSQLLVDARLATSKTEARRFLSDSAVYINGSQFSSEKTTLTNEDALHGYVVLRRGKNATVLVQLSA